MSFVSIVAKEPQNNPNILFLEDSRILSEFPSQASPLFFMALKGAPGSPTLPGPLIHADDPAFEMPRAINRVNNSRFAFCGAGPGQP